MADIRDWLDASRQTDTALDSMDAYAGSIEDREHPTEESAIALAACLAGRAIALAIREASVRADYLAHEARR